MFWDSREKTCERTQALEQAFCKCNEMTPGPNDLVVSPSEAGTMLNCHLSAPSPSPHHTHIPNRVLTYWRGYYIGPSGTFELECTPLMLWMWNISVPNSFPLGISKVSFPFRIQDQVGFVKWLPTVNLFWEAQVMSLRVAGTSHLWLNAVRASNDCICWILLPSLGFPLNSFPGPLYTWPDEAPNTS